MERTLGLVSPAHAPRPVTTERPPRVAGDLVVQVLGRRGPVRCRVKDLSLTGLYLRGVRAPEGREIRLSLPLPGEDPLDVAGRVVRCDAEPSPGVALTFSRIGWEDLLSIARYLAPRI